MASEYIDNISVRYSTLHSLSASNLKDSLECNICHTQAMWAQIAHAMSRLEDEPTTSTEPNDQTAQLQQQGRQLAKIMEEEMVHQEQMSVLSQMLLQQAEEVKAQSQEIRHIKKQQEAIEKLTSPHSPPREAPAISSCPQS